MAGGTSVVSGDDRTAAARTVCAGCGCLCDDISLSEPPYRQGRPNVETDCERGRRWFARRVFGEALEDRRPSVDGEPVALQEAAIRAAELLTGAAHPRVAGLERLPLGAQRKLVEVADRTGAGIDAGPSSSHLPSVLAVQRDGGHFLTLGEVRQRVDCLVLWFVEPHRTHPRLLERFYPDRREGGAEGEGRSLVAVGPRAEQTRADVALPVETDESLRLLWLVRLLTDDLAAPEREEDPLGETAAALVEHLREASCGAWLYGGGGSGGKDGSGDADRVGPDPVETVGVLRLLERLNDEAPWGARPLRGHGNPAGAEAVLTWQSGYPAAVTYRSGRPRHAGTAYAAAREARREDVDVVLMAGGSPSSLPPRDGPACVWLDTGDGGDPRPGNLGAAGDEGPEAPPRGGSRADAGAPEPVPAVRIPVLPSGARAGDTLLRMDGLPVRSPGIPGAGTWDGTPAEDAVDAVLLELTSNRKEGAAP